MAVPQAHNAPWTRKHDKPGTPLIPTAPTILYPQTLEDLIAICSGIAPGEGNHAAGSHWALSQAAISDRVFVETNDFFERIPAMGRTLYDVVPGCLSPGFLEALNESPSAPPGAVSAVPLRNPGLTYFFHIESGKRIYQAYAELDVGDAGNPESLCALMERDFDNTTFRGSWGFRTLGGAGGQTVLGALTTGTHGDDFDRPPLADSVIAMHIVAHGGKHYWIERELGEDMRFTDEAALRALYGSQRYGGAGNFEVIRSTETLDAALVQVGRFGIVYSLVMEADRQYGLRESLKRDTWENVKGDIANADSELFTEVFTDNDGVEILQRSLQVAVNPIASDNGGTHICGVQRRWTVSLASLSTPPQGRAERVGTIVEAFDQRLNAPRFSHAGNSIAYSPSDTSGTPNLFDRACADGDFAAGIVAAVYEELGKFIENHTLEIGGALAVAAAVAGPELLALLPELLIVLAILAALLDLFAAEGPPRLGQLLNELRGSLLGSSDPAQRAAGIFIWRAIAVKVFESEQEEQTYEAISYAIMDDHNYTDRSCEVNVDSVEVFFDAEDPNLIAFVDRLLLFENDQEWDLGLAVVGYISLRFTGPTRALIGPQPFARTVAVECSGLVDVDGSGQFVAFAEALARDPNIKGILHWGQRNNCVQSEIEQRFGDSPADPGGPLGGWRAVLSCLTENGRLDGFSSDFTRRAGLEVVQPVVGQFTATGPDGGPPPSYTLTWDCERNPPQTAVTITIVTPSGSSQVLAGLGLSGAQQLTANESGNYTLVLTASLQFNGETRVATDAVTIAAP